MQFRHNFLADFPPSVSPDEAPQPFAEGPGPFGDFVKDGPYLQVVKDSADIRHPDRTGSLEPMDEFDPIVQKIRPCSEGCGPAVEEIQGEMTADEEGVRGKRAHDHVGCGHSSRG